MKKGQAPLSVSFIDQSQGTQPLTYEWDFGDETPISYIQNPVHVYEEPGIYNVSMEVKGPYGSDVINQNGYIEVTTPNSPQAGFTAVPSSGRSPLNVSFIDQSTGTEPLSYNWTFGDGSFSIEPEKPGSRIQPDR